VGGWSFLPIQEPLATLHAWIWGVVLAAAGAGGVIALRRAPRIDAGLAVCAAVVVFTTLGMVYYSVLSQAVFGAPLANPWYFMTALPFMFVLVVRGLETIDRRLVTAAGAALAAVYVAIELYGTWVQMPAAYASTSDVAVQWARLTTIHPAILRGDFRWSFLAMHVGALCVVGVALLYVRRRRVMAHPLSQPSMRPPARVRPACRIVDGTDDSRDGQRRTSGRGTDADVPRIRH
jgi:hypothetical protein